VSDDDRRAYTRHELFAQVTVRNGSVDHVLSVLNLSRGGVLVDLGRGGRPRWLEMGRAVEIRVLAEGGACALEARGNVVRIQETEHHRTFAVQFGELVDETVVRDVLRAFGRPPPLPGA
jgi:hypothetical protein